MNYLSQVKVATEQLEDKIISHQEWAKIVLGEDYENVWSDEYLRRSARLFSIFVKNIEGDGMDDIDDEDKLAEIKSAQEALIKERKKLQTVNLAAQEYYRTIGRNELFNEQIANAIKNLDPVRVKHVEYTHPLETTGLLCIGDEHFDANFEIKGLFGETVNKYSKEIFKERMWYLLGQMENDRFECERLMVVSCGDALENILRMSSLQKVKYPVVDSAIEFAEFMTQWLVEAHNRLRVPVVFNIISGNHDIIRSIDSKPNFPEETLAKTIHEFIRLRLIASNVQDCDIKIEPYADVYYTNLYGLNIMFAHGEHRELSEVANYFENLYNIEVDTIIGAHYHSGGTKSIGVAPLGDREIVRIPSICGTDTYSKKLLKHNRAGAYFALYSENGKELSKTYWLN